MTERRIAREVGDFELIPMSYLTRMGLIYNALIKTFAKDNRELPGINTAIVRVDTYAVTDDAEKLNVTVNPNSDGQFAFGMIATRIPTQKTNGE